MKLSYVVELVAKLLDQDSNVIALEVQVNELGYCVQLTDTHSLIIKSSKNKNIKFKLYDVQDQQIADLKITQAVEIIQTVLKN